MKNSIVVLSLSVGLCLLLFSSLALASGITAKGIKIGLNLAKVSGEDVEYKWENKTGLCAGGFLTISLSYIID